MQPALLLGFTIPEAIAREVFVSDPLPAVQTHNFAWSLVGALRAAHNTVFLLSAVPIQNYPLVPQKWFSGGDFVEDGTEGRMLAFVNLMILKHLTRFFLCLAALPQLRRWGVRTVYIHGVHSPFLLFGALLRLLGYRVIPVLTDPPGVILPTDSKLAASLKRIDAAIIRMLIRPSTAVIALAPELARPYADRLPVLVLPGILNGGWLKRVRGFASATDKHKADRRPVVLYAGGLAAAYGADRLIDAALLLPDIDFIFYGKGDQVARLERGVATNILYKGFADADTLAEAMRDASILINPRPSGADFAVQSFPSKLIEYLATGRTVLTTRIRSIPAGLADCFAYIDDETPAGIAGAIRDALAQERAGADIVARIEALYGENAVGGRIAALAGNIPVADR
jgi:glycosyltransferase involved in cell wall biosynthesis